MEKSRKKTVINDTQVQVDNRDWYIIFIKSGIPIVGFLYLVFMAIGNKDTYKKNYAKAMILYRLTIYSTGIILIAIGLWISIPYIERLLAYMELL